MLKVPTSPNNHELTNGKSDNIQLLYLPTLRGSVYRDMQMYPGKTHTAK